MKDYFDKYIIYNANARFTKIDFIIKIKKAADAIGHAAFLISTTETKKMAVVEY